MDMHVAMYLSKRGLNGMEEVALKFQEITGARTVKESGAIQDAKFIAETLLIANDCAKADSSLAPLMHYVRSYADLTDWVKASLHIYRGQIQRVMYPLLIHVYIKLSFMVNKGYAYFLFANKLAKVE